MTTLFAYSVRSVWVRRRVTLATAAGIALVVFVLAASRMLASGLRGTLLAASSERRALVMQHDAFAESGSRVRQSVLTMVAAAPGVKRGPAGAPLVSGETINIVTLNGVRDASRLGSVQIRGVSPSAFAVRPEVRIISGRSIAFGSDEAIVGKGLADRYEGLSLAGAFELKKDRKIKIVGVFEAAGSAYESEVWADQDAVLTSLGWQGFLSSVTAELEARTSFEAFATALESDRQQGLMVEREKAYYSKVSSNLSNVIVGLGGLVTAIFSIGAMLGAMITMHSAVGQRRREIGVLRALGFSQTQVLLAFLAEATSLALFGGAVGLGIAMLTSFLDFSMTNVATGQELAFGFNPDLSILAGSLLAGTLVGVVGGLLPALRAARTSPLQAMRG